jgi:predicted enzyme related to lactoylglutathione lyase
VGTPITGIAAVAFDCLDPMAVALFWQRLLGGEVEADDDGVVELRSAGVRLDFARVAEGKQGKNRLHLDLGTDDLDAAVEYALEAGASVADDVYDGSGWRVLRDPEGNELCLLRPRDDPARGAHG